LGGLGVSVPALFILGQVNLFQGVEVKIKFNLEKIKNIYFLYLYVHPERTRH